MSKQMEANIPMMYRRHGNTTPKSKGHTLGNTNKPRIDRSSISSTNNNIVMAPVPQASTEPFVPKFIKQDKKVLSFEAYFLEAVHESGSDENYRVRRCIIYYYLEDSSMQIVEPKVENSGLPQGNFIKRHRIPKPSNSDDNLSFYSPADLNVGSNITCYGRTFRIVNADAFTRTYLLEESGTVVPEAEAYPVDKFFSKVDAELASKTNTNFGSKMNSMKEFMEASLGKFHRPSEHRRNFIDHDRHVLRFYAYWDDTRSLYGMKHRYTLHYFMADNTVEIRETFDRNSGCDPFPKLLNRIRLEKNPTLASPHAKDDQSSTVVKDDSQYYSWQELKIGNVIHIYGRELLLLDADTSTREWYQTHNLTLSAPKVVKEPVKAVKPFVKPPHTGIGSEEDSLASCFSLCPKPVTVSLDKIMNKRALTFSAKMDTTKPEDVGRIFVISYFVADKNIGIVEPPVRNSGIIGGKFLEKSRQLKPGGEKEFEPLDFFVGARLPLCGHVFILDGVDEYTLKYMESKPEEYKTSDAKSVFQKIHQAVTVTAGHQQAFENTISSMPSTKVSLPVLSELIALFVPSIVEHEVNTIVRYYGGGGDDKNIDISNIYQDVMSIGGGGEGGGSAMAGVTRLSKVLIGQKNQLLQNFRLQDAGMTGKVDRSGFAVALAKLKVSSMDTEMLTEFLFAGNEAADYSECIARLESL